MHAAGDRRGALGGGGRGGPSMGARGPGWVGYFVEVFGGLERKIWDAAGGGGKQCQGEGRKKEERRERHKKGVDRDKRGRGEEEDEELRRVFFCPVSFLRIPIQYFSFSRRSSYRQPPLPLVVPKNNGQRKSTNQSVVAACNSAWWLFYGWEDTTSRSSSLLSSLVV